MGMYDTIHFEEPRKCPNCGEEIFSVQTKKFVKLLNHYHVGDCVDHAEESRITRERLHCGNCREVLDKHVYLAVERGILLGVTDDRKEAKRLLENVNKEKLLLMYHDLYERYSEERKAKREYRNFLRSTGRWFRKGKHEKENLSPFEKFPIYSKHLVSAKTPLQAIENFLSYNKFLNALEELEERGMTTLDIYWLEDIEKGEDFWSVDVLQDELNEKCDLNWTWTVISEKQVEEDETDRDRLPFWNIVTEKKYSEETVKKTVKDWLDGRGFEFDVRIISPEEADGSGLLKKLEELEEKDLGSADFERLDDL